MPLRATLFGQIRSVLTGTPDFGSSTWEDDGAVAFHEFLDGTTANKADRVFADSRTLAASANEDLDLAGSLTNPFGVTVTFAKVKAIMITAAAGNTNSVVVKPGASNGFTGPFGAATHTLTIPPGGMLILAAPVNGWTVTASTGDLINVANSSSGSSVTYGIKIIGTSA